MSLIFRKKWEGEFEHAKERFFPPLTDENGEPFTDPSARGRKKAKAALDFAKEEHKRRAKKDGDPAKRQQRATYALGQAFAALSPHWKLLANWSNRQAYIRELSEHFGATTPLVEITSEKIRAYVEQCRTTKRKRWVGGTTRDSKDPANARFWKVTTPRAETTINQYCDALRAALKFGTEYMIDGKPILERAPTVPFYKPEDEPADPIPTNIASELWNLLPQHVREALVLSLLFGVRRAECFTLTISNIDFENCVVRLKGKPTKFAKGTKNGKGRPITGSPLAMAYLDQLVRQARERGTPYLVTYREYRKDPVEQAKVPYRAIKKPRHAWETAMDVIETRHGRRWRWHDLRANFISRIANTTGIFAASKLAGHSDVKVTDKHYGQLADKTRHDAADQVTNRPLIQAMLAGTSLAGVIEPTEPATKTPTENPDRNSSGSKNHLKLLK